VGGLSYVEHAKIFRSLPCENVVTATCFFVHQCTNWCQCLNLAFRCTRGTFSVQTWRRVEPCLWSCKKELN